MPRHRLTASITLLLCGLTASPAAAQTAAGWRRQATTLAQDGRFEEAKEALRESLKAEPRSVAAHVNLGILELRTGNPAHAVRLFEQALEIEPHHPNARLHLGIALLDADRDAEALAAFDELAKAPGGDPAVMVYRTHALLRLKRWEEAADWIGKFRTAAPRDAELHLLLAEWCLEADARQVLAAQLDHLLQLNLPASAEARARYFRGVVLARGGRTPEAATELRKAAVLDGSRPEYYTALFGALGEAEYDAETRELLRRAAERFPDSPEFPFFMALESMVRNEVNEALAIQARLQARFPDRADVHTLLGRLRLRLREMDAAAAAFRRALELEPDAPRANYYMAVLLRKTGDDATAKRRLDRCLRADPAYLEARLALAELFQDQRRFEDAVRELNNALALAPEMAEIHYRLSVNYRRLGQAEASKTHLAKYRQLSRSASP